MRAAFRAGKYPKTTPTAAEKKNAIMMMESSRDKGNRQHFCGTKGGCQGQDDSENTAKGGEHHGLPLRTGAGTSCS